MKKDIALKIGAIEYDAMDVNISGHNVYLNYKGPNAGAHTSYHASGQEQIKIGREYVRGTGGYMLKSALIRQRPSPDSVISRESPAPIGWTKSQIRSLPVRNIAADAAFDVSFCEEDHIVGLLVSVIGPAEPLRDETEDSYPVVGRVRFTDKVTVEIEAFVIK